MTGGSEKQPSSRCSIVSRLSRRPDLPAGRPPRAGQVKEGRRPARRRRALSLTGLSTVAPFLRSRRRKGLTLNTVSLLLPEQRWCSLRNLNPPMEVVLIDPTKDGL